MMIYKVCFFSGSTYFEQFFSTEEMAEKAVETFDGVAVVEKYKV